MPRVNNTSRTAGSRLSTIDIASWSDFDVLGSNSNISGRTVRVPQTSLRTSAAVPPLPFESFMFAGELSDEITCAINLLTSHIFELYSMGEFRLFNKLLDIYNRLDEMRVILTHETLTQNEVRITKETVTSLFSLIPKSLASRAARSNEECYDLDNKHTDVSAYKAVLARDTIDGTLLSMLLSLPSQLALNQELCALLPKFPINAHHDFNKYVIHPQLKKKLTHDLSSHVLVYFESFSGLLGHQPTGFGGMIAYLYIRSAKKRLSESFAIYTDSADLLFSTEKASAAIFRNIPAAEVKNNRIYLVAILTKEISLEPKNTKVSQITMIKKGVAAGVAAGVADITRMFSRNKNSMASGESHLFSIPLFGSYMSLGKEAKTLDPVKIEDNGWEDLIDRIIRNINLGVAINSHEGKLVVYVKEIKNQNESTIGDRKILSDSRNSDAVPLIESDTEDTKPVAKIWLIFFDPLAEDCERIYLKIGKLTLTRITAMDELLTVVVSAPNNSNISFAKASNQIEKANWQFMSVFSGETAGEIVKVRGIHLDTTNVPASDHLTLSLYCNGVYAGEGRVIYKNNGKMESLNEKPFTHVVINGRLLKSPIGEVQVRTEYVGKQISTDAPISAVLNYTEFLARGSWGQDKLVRSMASFCDLELAELVIFYSELVNALFALTDACLRNPADGSLEKILTYCFKCVVHLLDTLFGRQDLYLYLFDQYLETYTVSAESGIFFLNKLTAIYCDARAEWTAFSRSSCRVLGFILRLALTPSGQSADKKLIMKALSHLCDAAAFFVAIESPILVSDQILTLEMPDFFSHYEDQLDKHELLSMIVRFFDSVGTKGLGFDEDRLTSRRPAQASKDHMFCITKLLVIQRLFAWRFVLEPELAALLVEKSVSWAMDIFLGAVDIDPTRLAALVMNCVCDLVTQLLEEEVMRLVCFSLTKHLGVVARTILKYNKFLKSNDFFGSKKSFTYLFQNSFPFTPVVCDPVVGEETIVEVLVELSVVFVYMARLGKQAAGSQGLYLIHSTAWEGDFYHLAKLNSSNGLSEDMSATISGIQLIRQGQFFTEEKWLSLYATLAEGCLLALELLAPLMTIHFVPDIDRPELFDRSLWGKFFRNLLKLAVIKPVSIEHLSTLPRKACFQITSTIRDRLASVLTETWNMLAWEAPDEDRERFNLSRFGGYQVEFISSDFGILPDLMLFALQRNDNSQKATAVVLWSVIVSEYILSDSIVDVEKECLLGLHSIFTRGAYKPSINEQRLFMEHLKNEIRLDSSDEAFALVVKFARNISGFLNILNDLNKVPTGSQFKDDRTFHKLKINAYLKEANKPELFHSFVHQMYEDNCTKGDYIQAALCLQLMADTYEWDHSVMLPQSYRPKFPQQTSFERKEALIKMIAQNYVQGNSLERAIDTYNGLLEAYNEYSLDLKSFAYVHQKLAKLYLQLKSCDKFSPSYFKVAYIGNGFPSNMRGQELIIEGLPFEHITAVHERLHLLFPGASIVSSEEQLAEL